jgi:pyrroloquinoline quinone biosynthesis protein D
VVDGGEFDPVSSVEDTLSATEVDLGRSEIVEALVVSVVVVVADEGRDGPSGVTREIVVFEQDAALSGVSATSVLRLARHVVFRFDDARQRWITRAPERLMLPDEQAVEILHLVAGKTSGGGIVDAFATRYTEAVRELIARDVAAMLQDRADKGCLTGDSSD